MNKTELIKCTTCGEEFDPSHLPLVFLHEHNEDINPSSVIGIKGKQVTVTAEEWLKKKLQRQFLKDCHVNPYDLPQLMESYAEQVAKDAFLKGRDTFTTGLAKRNQDEIDFNKYWKSVTNKPNKEILNPKIEDEWFEPRKDGLNPNPNNQ